MKLKNTISTSMLASVLFTLSTVMLPAFGQAQDFPNKPIKVVVPFVPGGGSDSVARVIAKGMTEQLGQPSLLKTEID